MLTHAQLVASLERRYDYYSARVVAKEALSGAQLKEKQTYAPEEVKALLVALGHMGARVESVIQELRGVAAEPEPAKELPAHVESAASLPVEEVVEAHATSVAAKEGEAAEDHGGGAASEEGHSGESAPSEEGERPRGKKKK